MKKNRKFKTNLLRGFSRFQKFWIILLLLLLAVSLCLTVIQLFILLLMR